MCLHLHLSEDIKRMGIYFSAICLDSFWVYCIFVLLIEGTTYWFWCGSCWRRRSFSFEIYPGNHYWTTGLTIRKLNVSLSGRWKLILQFWKCYISKVQGAKDLFLSKREACLHSCFLRIWISCWIWTRLCDQRVRPLWNSFKGHWWRLVNRN